MSTALHVPPAGPNRATSCRMASFGTALLLSVATAPLHADEGMWTLTDFPRERILRKYEFNASDEWLKKVQLASLRLANGCSGAFVSPQGLVMSEQVEGELELLENVDKVLRRGHLSPQADHAVGVGRGGR